MMRIFYILILERRRSNFPYGAFNTSTRICEYDPPTVLDDSFPSFIYFFTLDAPLTKFRILIQILTISQKFKFN